ncbi:2,' 3'-cyclic nucleotide 2'-phosphodiesterase [Paenibacillus sp. FSL M7-0547]|uniref:stalk domain-containing protein n=1 Tax=Paenibacillus sp. FSL M7-0547 TaxID=2954755 RepID=UPI0030FA4ADF
MKKLTYMLSGIVIGAVLMASSSAFADQIKSLTGKTVAGEYTVRVDGKTLNEKALIVDNKAHVPLRAVSDSLGAKIEVEGKNIEITTKTPLTSEINDVVISNQSNSQSTVKSKEELQQTKDILQNKMINPSKDRKEVLIKQITDLKVQIADAEKTIIEAEQKGWPEYEKKFAEDLKTRKETALEKDETELKVLEANLSKYESQLTEIEEALNLISKQ